MLYAKNRVVDDMFQLQLLGQIVGNETLRQFIGSDGVQQVELIHSVQRLLYRYGIKQIAHRNLYAIRQRRSLFAHENANLCTPLLQLFHHFRADTTRAACH